MQPAKKVKLATRHRKRSFRLEICLPCIWPLEVYARDVINSIEPETIMVADPTNSSTRDYSLDSDGAYLVDSDATLPVPIKDWLAIGCQRIRWQHADEKMPDGVVGMYSTNIDVALGNPYSDSPPFGPSVFVGEIVLPSMIQKAFHEYSQELDPTDLVHTFQFVLAHEFVHVLDTLKYLVPAFINWRAFLRNVLDEGCCTDLMYSRMADRSIFIDNYGQQHELNRILYYWPTRAQDWFRTRELDWNELFHREK